MAGKTEKNPVIAFKGFDENLRCRGYQYEIGKTYTHEGGVLPCHSGFHSCEHPFEVWAYYEPGRSRFALVELGGDIKNHSYDTKLASAEITIRAELTIPELVQRGVDYILSKIADSKTESNTGDRSAATNTGDRSAATNTGDRSAATNTGDRSAATNTGHQSAATNTGDRSAATNTGDQSAATNTGHQSAATNTGHQSAATNTGHWSAATNTGDQSAATNTGDQSAATNTGDRSAATNTGDQSAASVGGEHSIAIASGYQAKAKAGEGSAICLVERSNNMEIIHVFAGIAKRRGKVRPDTYYTLQGGKLVEVA
jgi:hypothetical protein